MALSIRLRLPNRVQPEVLPPPGVIGTHTNKLHYMKQYLLDKLPTKPFALDFMQPVDTEALHVPTYYTIIRRPMDVGTIIKRVENRFYDSVEELIADFRQIISNCYKFNRPKHTVFRNGRKLEKFFYKILSQMPKGEEVDSYIDPKVPSIHYEQEKAFSVTEQQCQELLKKLHNCCCKYLVGTDVELRDFFKDNWIALSKKLSEHQFETIKDSHIHIDGIFLQFRNKNKRICENTLYELVDNISYIPLNWDLRELLYETKKAKGNWLEPYDTQTRWKDSLMSGLDFVQNFFTVNLTNDTYQKVRSKVQWKECRERLNSHWNDIVPDSPDSNDSDIQTFSEAERRAIQEQFVMLPLDSKIEIMQIIAQTEEINAENCDLQWFDIKNFGTETLQMMKKAMHPHTKINLRNMKASEKEDLQRSLENRLRNINIVLNGNRPKYTYRMQFRSTVKARKRSRLEAKVAVGEKSVSKCGAEGSSKEGLKKSSCDSNSSSSDSDSSSDSSDSSSDSEDANVMDSS